MKFRLLLIIGCLLWTHQISAQSDVDVTKLTADTQTFIFSDNKSTVKNYIYAELEGKTACCGSDRIYLEVRIDPTGWVVQAKTLTGKNECFKKSAMDIVKNIKWNAKDFKAPKSVYFEIKPEMDCEGRDNSYQQIQIFHNEKLDANGVPLTYASSTGVSASKASGGTVTPTGVPARPTEEEMATTVEETEEDIAASDEVQTPPVVETEEADEVEPEAQPEETVAATPQSSPSQPIASSAQPATTTPAAADEELERVKRMAELERKKYEEEVARLKAEKEAAEAEKEAQASRLDEERRRRQQAEKERNNIAAKNKQYERNQIASRNDSRSNSSRGQDDGYRNESSSRSSYDYRSGNSGRDRDRYNSGDGDAPQRQLSASERARDEKRRMEEQMNRLASDIRQQESENRRITQDAERRKRELAKLQEDILRKDEEIRKQQEQEELQRIEKERRDAEERKRQQEREVQRQMDELKRKQAEVDRMIADLQRVENELKQKEDAKVQKEQEITLEQTKRQQMLEAQIDQLKMTAGTSAPVNSGTSPSAVSSLMVSDSGGNNQAVMVLAQQIDLLRQEILRLQMSVGQGGGTPRGGTTVRTPVTRTSKAPASSTQQAASNSAWKKIEMFPEDRTAYQGVPVKATGNIKVGDRGPDASHADTHKNLPGPDMKEPVYKGGDKATMKRFIAEELRKGGVCGLAQSVFELTVSPTGTVTSYRVFTSNNVQVATLLPGILTRLEFQPTGTQISSISYVEFKAEIVCEGNETRINIREVEDILNAQP
ncbi:MAG: hypothetical protein AAGI38_09055 [Bacteroidota bacterium]